MITKAPERLSETTEDAISDNSLAIICFGATLHTYSLIASMKTLTCKQNKQTLK